MGRPLESTCGSPVTGSTCSIDYQRLHCQSKVISSSFLYFEEFRFDFYLQPSPHPFFVKFFQSNLGSDGHESQSSNPSIEITALCPRQKLFLHPEKCFDLFTNFIISSATTCRGVQKGSAAAPPIPPTKPRSYD